MLSHLRITAAKPAAKPFNLSDGQGLFLTVQPNGSKIWKLSFRHLGKQKTLHLGLWPDVRSEEHTSELQSLMRISYAVFCLKKKKQTTHNNNSLTVNT